MKFYLSLCLFFITQCTNATIQIAVNADVAPQLCLASYAVVQSGAYYVTGNCSVGWTNSVGYAFSEIYPEGTNLNFNGGSLASFSGNIVCSPCDPLVGYAGVGDWTQSWIENGTDPMLFGAPSGATIIVTTTAGTYIDTYTNASANLQWGWENANYTASAPLFSPGEAGYATISRTVVTILKLKTGGPTVSKMRNVFGLNASIQQVAPDFPLTCWVASDPIDISGWTTLTNGPVSIQTNWLQVFPDNDNVVVTPPNFGLNDYMFNLTPTKYHSYFDIFVEPASLWPLESGHVFCRFRTDAPTNALQYISTNLTKYLDQCEGFYPDNNNDLEGHPGQLQLDNHTEYYFNRSFYIGFPDLLNGLAYVQEINDNPPNYNLGVYDCINFAVVAGWDAGIDNMRFLDFPGFVAGDVARNLSRSYPGPWLNNPMIYYP